MKKLIILSSLGFFLASCSTVGYVSTPSEYTPGGKEVKVEKSNANVLLLTPMNTHKTTQESLKKLEDQCPSGLKNVTTSVSARDFLIVLLEKLEISANCK